MTSLLLLLLLLAFGALVIMAPLILSAVAFGTAALAAPSEKTALAQANSTGRPAGPQKMVIADVTMPFGSMVTFMVKWSLASIPAMFIVGTVLGTAFVVVFSVGGAVLFTFFGTLMAIVAVGH